MKISIEKKRWYSSLQSIRGIAVLFVVLFHLNESLFHGGYIGVDIFFGLSGFVVLNSVLAELKSRKFKAKKFFYKRFMRLQPVALVCIILTLIMAVFFLIPFGSLGSFYGGAFSSIGIMNWWLMRISQDYFAGPIDQNLFMQFWSLSIEEQYYFIFGIVAVVITYFRRSDLLEWSLILITAFSMFIFLGNSKNFMEPEIYFNTFARIWEITVGALMICLADKIPLQKYLLKITFYKKPLVSFLFELRKKYDFELMLFLLLTPLIFIAYPSKTWVILISILTSSYLFIIRIIDNLRLELDSKNIDDHFEVNQINPLKLFNHLGKLSYSIYLWHWPVIFFSKRYIFEISKQTTLSYFLMLVITYILANISYSMIESRFQSIAKNKI